MIIRKSSSRQRWKQVQRPTTGHYAEEDSKLEISIGVLPLDLRKPIEVWDAGMQKLERIGLRYAFP